MREFRVFHVAYDRGYMDLNVGMFFGASPKVNIKKALRLIRQNCLESDRQKLLDDLRFEYEIRTVILSEFGETECSRRKLKKQKDRIKECMELLKKERWG